MHKYSALFHTVKIFSQKFSKFASGEGSVVSVAVVAAVAGFDAFQTRYASAARAKIDAAQTKKFFMR